MVYGVVGIALFVLGALAGRVGPKLGTVLAVVPALVWFALLAQANSMGTIDGPAGNELLAYLLIGLIAFLVGSHITNLSRPSRKGVGRE